VVIKITVMIN